MWVIYFQGKATYWLECHRLYTIGRKDTDVVILEDSSISRLHLNVTVGQVTNIAALGKHLVNASQAQQKIKQGALLSVSPRKHQQEAKEGGDEDDEANMGVEALHSVTNVSELSQLFPAAPLSFQDLSKYGSTLEYHDPISGKHVAVKLRNGGQAGTTQTAGGGGGTSYITPALAGAPDNSTSGNTSAIVTLPHSLHRCSLRVGTHEAVFEFRWEPTFVLVGSLEGGGNNSSTASTSPTDWAYGAIAKCGFIILNALMKANPTDSSATAAASLQLSTKTQIVSHTYLPTHILRLAAVLITAEINPTPLLMASMCASKPIVGLQYLETILARISPKVPLPDSTSILSAPKKIAPFFTTLIGGTTNVSADQLLPSIFVARAERSTLFSFTTFVAIQRAVFDELKSYIPLADGHIVFDDVVSQSVGTNGPTSTTDDKSPQMLPSNVLDSFYLRHSHRVLVYIPPKTNKTNPSAETLAVSALISDMSKRKLPSVEYTSILSAIVRSRKLDLPTSGSKAANLLGQKRGRDLNSGAEGTDVLLGGPEGASGGRRTEGNAVFDDDGDDVQPTIDLTGPAGRGGLALTPQQGRRPQISTAHKNRLLVGETSKWKSREELRAQTSALLFPQNGDDDDDPNHGAHFGVPPNNEGTAQSSNPAAATNLMASSRSRQLVAHDPLSGNNNPPTRTTADATTTNSNIRSDGAQHQTFGYQHDEDEDDDDNFGAALPTEEISTENKVLEDDTLIVKGPPQLPPYPCFQRYVLASTNGAAALLSTDNNETSVINTKTFKKQILQPPTSIIELEADVNASLPARTNAAVAAPTVYRSADDDDIIPMGATHYGSGHTSAAVGRFNPFDVAAHNQQQRRAGRVTATAALHSSPAAGHANEEVASTTPATGRGGRGRGRGRGGRGAAAAVPVSAPVSPSRPTATPSTAPPLTGPGAGATSAMLRAARKENNNNASQQESQELGLALGRNLLNATGDSQAADIFDVDNLY